MTTVQDSELDIIKRISIDTPAVISVIDSILVTADKAKAQLLKARDFGGPTTLLTKSGTDKWDKSKFYPERQKIVTIVKKKAGNQTFYPMASRRVPMLDDNMGPTGWLLKHDRYGGDLRINLFNKNNSILKLAKDYIDYRNRNIPLFFQIYVKALKGTSKTRGNLVLSILDAFDLINKKIKKENLDKDGLNSIGIGVLSFCQTWAKQNKEDGSIDISKPQFSVMSPHFQTRFYIKDLDLLNSNLGIEFPETEYKRVLDEFVKVMRDYNGSFINIDELIQSITPVLDYSLQSYGDLLDIAGGRRKRKKKKTKKRNKRRKKRTRRRRKSRRRRR